MPKYILLEAGFSKANINNLPKINNLSIYNYIGAKVKEGCAYSANIEPKKFSDDNGLRVDYVQLKSTEGVTEIKALVFSTKANIVIRTRNSIEYVMVYSKINNTDESIMRTLCGLCTTSEVCDHILTFLFWLHRQSTDTEALALIDFWGYETECYKNEMKCMLDQLRNQLECDELRNECDSIAISPKKEEGSFFLKAVLDKMDNSNLKDLTFYKHYRPMPNEFEPLFIHHALLNNHNNGIKCPNTFNLYMAGQGRHGLFDRLDIISRNAYKTPLWLEVQYMRIRCSLVHSIVSRKSNEDIEAILEKLFCKTRINNVAEKQRRKQHKYFILNQTEKLENKIYRQCGILINRIYPYICASPDGITDDHIVEIKSPKTQGDFEKYLEGSENIAPKYMAQIQMQMFMANVSKALYCVLSPNFDENGALHYVWVQADREFVTSILNSVDEFWKQVVFPRLSAIYLGRA